MNRSDATGKRLMVRTSRSPALIATVRPAGRVILPLNNEQALLSGRLTLLLQDHLAHLGVWIPFAKAAALLVSFTQTIASESTAQRQVEALGMAYAAVKLAEVKRIEREFPRCQPDRPNWS